MRVRRRAFLLAMAVTLGALPQPGKAFAETTEKESYCARVYVSEEGDDRTADGTKQHPYKTVEAAQKKVENIQNSADYVGGNIAVTLRGGTYRIGTIRLGVSESGSEKGKVVYRAEDGENVRIVNSTKLNVSDFKLLEDNDVLKRLPISARDKVYSLDLTKYTDDETYIGYAYIKNMSAANFGRRGTTRLFLNNKPQTISRWPNAGYKDLLLADGTSSVVSDGSSGGDIVLAFDDANPMRWSTANDMVIRGYMMNVYVGASYNVKSTDSETKQITLANIYGKGLTISDDFGPKRRWYAENLLEEIDIPGEYYIDEKEKILYWYPPYELSETDLPEIVCGTGNGGNNMFELNGASYVSFENLMFEQTEYKAISIINSNNITIDGCTVAYTQSNGIQVGEGCSDITVKNCVIHNTAASGIYASLNLTNEQIVSLENTGIVIENNHIYKSGENSTYPWPAIHTDGIGDIVKNNTIHQTPVCGVEFASPNGMFAYNEVYKTVYDTADSGAMHIGGDWRRYGINVEYNYIHDVGTKETSESYDMPVAGIYWDEVQSGTVQKNNIIVLEPTRKTDGIFMNGGRDHTAEGNIIVGANTAFKNPNTHSGYYLVAPDSTLKLHPTHSGLSQTYEKFLSMYSDDDYRTSAHYEKYGKQTDELANDVAAYQIFSAKNLNFNNNAVVGCGKETDFTSNGNDNPLTAEQERRYYQTDTNFILKKINFSSTVTAENYTSEKSDGVFMDSEHGDYRISDAGKAALNITDSEFNLDTSFDLAKIGCRNDITLSDGFKMLYPKNGESTNTPTSVCLVWENALFADEYEYTVYDENGDVKESGTTMYTNVTVDGLNPDTEYSWTVHAKYASAVSNANEKGGKSWTSVDGRQNFKTPGYMLTAENISYDAEKSKIYLNVTNNGDEETTMFIVAAYEDDGTFKGCKMENITIPKGKFSASFDVSGVKKDFENGILAAFIWTDDGMMKPLLGRKVYVK